MISLDQVRTLASRVQRVITRLRQIEDENRELRERIASHEQRLAEFQQQLDRQSADSEEIERGILSTLEQLDEVDTDRAASATASGGAGCKDLRPPTAAMHKPNRRHRRTMKRAWQLRRNRLRASPTVVTPQRRTATRSRPSLRTARTPIRNIKTSSWTFSKHRRQTVGVSDRS